MKHLLIALLSLFAFNTYASDRCVIAFMNEGNENIEQKELSKRNYQEAGIFDIQEGEYVSSIKDLYHNTDLSDEDFQAITFTQIIEKTFKQYRENDLRLEVVHTKNIVKKLPTKTFNTLTNTTLFALIGKLRVENLPTCK